MEKHVPMRRCVGCMQSKPKSELVKVNPDQPGKGIYVCNNENCIAKAMKKNKLPEDFKLLIGRI